LRFEPTLTRVWKRLSKDERLAAAKHLLAESGGETMPAVLAAIVSARRVRPQVARTLPADEQARILGSVLDPGEPLAGSLLVSLHLGERRAMLAAFLEAAGLPHEGGILKEDADAAAQPLPDVAATAGMSALAAFPGGEVRTYLNTLFLQDPERWAALRSLPEPA
jgi:hypothetical protein